MLTVRRRPGVASQGLLNVGGTVFRCALGRTGIVSIKREGDGATPLGLHPLLSGYFRRGRTTLTTRLPMTLIAGDLGWCDAPGDRNYNRPVRLPYNASHEAMRRKDQLYDVCLVMNCNIVPRRRGGGSALFFHLARPGYTPTEGCIAVAPRTMARLLPFLSRSTLVRVIR